MTNLDSKPQPICGQCGKIFNENTDSKFFVITNEQYENVFNVRFILDQYQNLELPSNCMIICATNGCLIYSLVDLRRSLINWKDQCS